MLQQIKPQYTQWSSVWCSTIYIYVCTNIWSVHDESPPKAVCPKDENHTHALIIASIKLVKARPKVFNLEKNEILGTPNNAFQQMSFDSTKVILGARFHCTITYRDTSSKEV